MKRGNSEEGRKKEGRRRNKRGLSNKLFASENSTSPFYSYL
jgi:hypothetical protein